MNKLNKVILLTLFVAFRLGTSFAQIDTLFYFAPPWVTPDHNPKQPVKFHISSFSAPSTTVTIQQPASPLSMDTTFVMGPGQLVDIVYWRGAAANPFSLGYDSLETRPADVVRTNGVRIRSSTKITVVYDVITVTPNNPETYSLKGQNAFGTEFLCPFQTKWNNRNLGTTDNNGDGITTMPKSQINIIAIKPNTTVWITPRCNIVGHVANVTYSVFLPVEGACYTAENITMITSVPGQNLGGSIVVSDKPIAVTVSDDSVNPGNISGITSCYDLMGDQIVPVELVGTDYIINRGQLNPQTGEAFFVVATQNFTSVDVITGLNVDTTVLLNKGDTYTHNLTNDLTYVRADKNIYLLHASGYGCELGEALLPPLNCAGSDSVTFTRNNGNAFFLNVLCKQPAISSFTLANSSNTMQIAQTQFTVIPATATLQGGPFYGTQLGPFTTAQIPVNSSNLLFNSAGSAGFFAMGVFNGTQTGGALFHYMSSFLRRTEVKTGTVTPICAGQEGTVAVTGTVSGAALTGIWTTSYVSGTTTINGGGTGTFSPVYSSALGTISTVYSVSINDTTSSAATKTITLYLTSTGSCKNVTDSVKLEINQRAVVSVSGSTVLCKNNIFPVILSGSVTNAVSGMWSGGNGGAFGAPAVVTTYTPSQQDMAANTITLSFTSLQPLYGCPNTVKTVTVGFIDPPVVTVVPNVHTACTNSSTLALNGNVSGVTTTGIWQGGTGAYTLTNTSPTATYILSPNDLTQSSITLTLSSTNPGICANETATVLINIIDKPSVAIPSNATVCAGAGSIVLTGSVTGSATQGVWTTTNGVGFFSQQQPQTSPVNTTYFLSQLDTSGSIDFTLESFGGICPVEKASFNVAILAAPVVKVEQPFMLSCKGVEIALTGTVTGYTTSGEWATSSMTTTPGTFTPGANFLNTFYLPSEADYDAGFVVLTLSSTNNQLCPASSAAFTASFIPSPEAGISGPAAACLGEAILFSDNSNMNGTGAPKYSWEFGDQSVTGRSSAVNPRYTYTSTGNYVVTLTVTGISLSGVNCPDTASHRIRVVPLPIADFSHSSACQDQPVIFTNNSTNIKQWDWDFGDGTKLTTGIPTTTVAHTYTVAGPASALLYVTSSGFPSCKSNPTFKSFNISNKPKAEFGMTNNPSVVQEPVYFSDFTTPVGNINSWFWEFGDGEASTDPVPVHTYQKAGLFNIKLTVIDKSGCIDTLTKAIDVTLLPQVPGAFSPNNDGVNDLLYVKGGPFEKILFRVYNNWGEMLWETADQTLGWDGRKNGIEQPNGVYVWTLTVDMYNNRQVKKNGDITLIR